MQRALALGCEPFRMTKELQELFEKHCLVGVCRQRQLARQLGEHSCHYEAESGELVFSSGSRIAVQSLGLESERGWLWSWDAGHALPDLNRQSALRLKALGEEWGVTEWTTSPLPSLDLPGVHSLALTAVGVLGAGGFYRVTCEGGVMLALLPESPLDRVGGVEWITTLGDAISNYEIPNHLQAVRHFCQQRGWLPEEEGNCLKVCADDGVRVICHFDDQKRLKKLSSEKPVIPAHS